MKYIYVLTLFLSAALGWSQNNAIFGGGINDGWSLASIEEPSNNIFNGGADDGWAMTFFSEPDNNIYNGGIDDGWAFLISPIYNWSLLAVEENTFGSLLKAYPNPTTSQLNIDLGAFYETTDVEIYNTTGQVISIKKHFRTDTLSIDIEGAKGIYFIKITSESKVATVKILKK